MKKTFNQKFGPKNNPALDLRVLQSIKNENKFIHPRWFVWSIGICMAVSITFCTLTLDHSDHTRESYVQSVLEVQKSLDENVDREFSSDANDSTRMETDET